MPARSLLSPAAMPRWRAQRPTAWRSRSNRRCDGEAPPKSSSCFSTAPMSPIVYCRGTMPSTARPENRCEGRYESPCEGSCESSCEMNPLQASRAILEAWTGVVAATIVAGFERMVSPRLVRLVEDDQGMFALQAAGRTEALPAEIAFRDGQLAAPNLAQLFRGSRVEIVLRPARFLFRPLELPARAAGFLDGIVRAQIDRLTPWSASEAVFGCSAPAAPVD